ncbi:hypothetical protein D320_08957 [Haloferax sp. BAB-2207]|nr:hypothetical protein D320_08957 [Haloferax sp. BAB-2207]
MTVGDSTTSIACARASVSSSRTVWTANESLMATRSPGSMSSMFRLGANSVRTSWLLPCCLMMTPSSVSSSTVAM